MHVGLTVNFWSLRITFYGMRMSNCPVGIVGDRYVKYRQREREDSEGVKDSNPGNLHEKPTETGTDF